MVGYVLTPDAEKDLEEVWSYTFEKWGADQADHYLSQIEICCERIAAGEAYCRSFPEVDARLKSHHCQHHYIFFLETADRPTVLAVLFERMNLLVQLRPRLR